MLTGLANETFRIKGRRVANKSCSAHERDATDYAPSLVATTACWLIEKECGLSLDRWEAMDAMLTDA